MSKTIRIIGQRIRNFRIQNGFSQEKLAELAGCHPTYIGQIERGEKNATIESIEKITLALNISLSTLFDGLGKEYNSLSKNTLLLCNEFLSYKKPEELNKIYKILLSLDEYKNI